MENIAADTVDSTLNQEPSQALAKAQLDEVLQERNSLLACTLTYM
jgi:hypothetical protein